MAVDPQLKPFLLSHPATDLAIAAPLLKEIRSTSPSIIKLPAFKKGSARPLAGLRIALDPGHIGGKGWDELTGKYIIDSKGGRLSEGIMAQEVALLLEQDLKKMGAEVLLTKRTLEPVSKQDFKLYKGHESDFFLGPELDDRAVMIRAFNPHLTLILHFDENTPGGDPNIDHEKKRCNFTMAYVPGGFVGNDLKETSNREFFKKIANEPEAWKQSLELSKAITSQIHSDLDIPLNNQGGGNTLLVTPGVFARNLRLQRQLAGYVSSYLELLCYEAPKEFELLQKETLPI
ncbi:MAG: N-acetylmuramoyl-L-alanine amidase, partial [Bdellovibrionota bacterium]